MNRNFRPRSSYYTSLDVGHLQRTRENTLPIRMENMEYIEEMTNLYKPSKEVIRTNVCTNPEVIGAPQGQRRIMPNTSYLYKPSEGNFFATNPRAVISMPVHPVIEDVNALPGREEAVITQRAERYLRDKFRRFTEDDELARYEKRVLCDVRAPADGMTTADVNRYRTDKLKATAKGVSNMLFHKEYINKDEENEIKYHLKRKTNGAERIYRTKTGEHHADVYSRNAQHLDIIRNNKNGRNYVNNQGQVVTSFDDTPEHIHRARGNIHAPNKKTKVTDKDKVEDISMGKKVLDVISKFTQGAVQFFSHQNQLELTPQERNRLILAKQERAKTIQMLDDISSLEQEIKRKGFIVFNNKRITRQDFDIIKQDIIINRRLDLISSAKKKILEADKIRDFDPRTNKFIDIQVQKRKTLYDEAYDKIRENIRIARRDFEFIAKHKTLHDKCVNLDRSLTNIEKFTDNKDFTFKHKRTVVKDLYKINEIITKMDRDKSFITKNNVKLLEQQIDKVKDIIPNCPKVTVLVDGKSQIVSDLAQDKVRDIDHVRQHNIRVLNTKKQKIVRELERQLHMIEHEKRLNPHLAMNRKKLVVEMYKKLDSVNTANKKSLDIINTVYNNFKKHMENLDRVKDDYITNKQRAHIITQDKFVNRDLGSQNEQVVNACRSTKNISYSRGKTIDFVTDNVNTMIENNTW